MAIWSIPVLASVSIFWRHSSGFPAMANLSTSQSGMTSAWRGLLLHVLVVIVDSTDILQDFLLFFVQCEGQGMGEYPGDVGLNGVFGSGALRHGTGHPEHEFQVLRISSARASAHLDLLYGLLHVSGFSSHQDNYPICDPVLRVPAF